jgi:hypothetical protein
LSNVLNQNQMSKNVVEVWTATIGSTRAAREAGETCCQMLQQKAMTFHPPRRIPLTATDAAENGKRGVFAMGPRSLGSSDNCGM